MSHHFDTRLATRDPRLNVADAYLFDAAPDRTVMVMTCSADAGTVGSGGISSSRTLRVPIRHHRGWPRRHRFSGSLHRPDPARRTWPAPRVHGALRDRRRPRRRPRPTRGRKTSVLRRAEHPPPGRGGRRLRRPGRRHVGRRRVRRVDDAPRVLRSTGASKTPHTPIGATFSPAAT